MTRQYAVRHKVSRFVYTLPETTSLVRENAVKKMDSVTHTPDEVLNLEIVYRDVPEWQAES